MSTTCIVKHSFLSVRSDPFRELIVNCFTEMDNPLSKLRYPSMKKLFDNCKTGLPSEGKARKIVISIAEKKLNAIRDLRKNKQLFIMSDQSERYSMELVNVIAGSQKLPPTTYIIASKPVQSTNSKNICCIINDALRKMNFQREDLLLFLSDAAPYMINCLLTLKFLYLNVRHVTCLSHLIHTRVDPLASILAVLARSCQILTTSWQPWIPWQDSYKDLTKIILIPRSYLITMDKILRL